MNEDLLTGLTLTSYTSGTSSSKQKSMPNESETQSSLKELLNSTIEDVSLAIEAADMLARRSKKDVVIQEDLSVVFEEDATKRVLETIRSF
jgi:hypothetical protein